MSKLVSTTKLVDQMNKVNKLNPKKSVMDSKKRSTEGFVTDFSVPVKGKPPQLVWVDPSLLYIDSMYQRELNVPFVQNMVEQFDWALFGAITISLGIGGRYAVTDGQHRTIAAMIRPDIDLIPAILDTVSIHKVASTKVQADTFVGINTNRNAINYLDSFYASLAAEETWAILVDKVVFDAKLHYPAKAGKYQDKEIHIFKKMKSFLDATLLNDALLLSLLNSVVKGLGPSKDTLCNSCLGAILGLFVKPRHIQILNDPVAFQALSTALSNFKGDDTVLNLIERSRIKSKLDSTTGILVFQNEVIQAYNKEVQVRDRLDLFYVKALRTRSHKRIGI